MDDLFNAGTVEFNFAIMAIADRHKREGIMTTSFRLDREFCSRSRERLRNVTWRFFVSLNAINDLERWCSSQNKRCRNTSVARATRVSDDPQIERRGVPFVNTLPLNLRLRNRDFMNPACVRC